MNKYRPTKGGTPSFDKVMQAAALLARHKVPFALLCVVNRDVARRPLDVWRFLTSVPGTYRVQFTPCVEPRTFKQQGPAQADPAAPALGSPRTRPEHPLSIVTDWSVDARDYGEFLCAIWREWLAFETTPQLDFERGDGFRAVPGVWFILEASVGRAD